jgi:LDH2 family malate/lactate/ureidoglycolate dehydrogenase
MIALNIAAFQPLAEFGGRMERYIAELKSVPLAQGFDEIVYPGEIEARNDTRHRAEGLLLAHDTRSDLRDISEAFDVELPF